ncbi:MAG: response regulator, partial [Lachnospiraceae bacterium]|nr:response regulator [Lachnospiraceae bacterium]
MNVLIVDDEIYVVRALQKNIDWASLGVEHAWIAFNAAKARELFEKEEIQILVTDIEMPGESGLDLAEWVAEKYPDCKIIFLTSHAEFSYAQRAMRCTAMDYVLKPLDFTSFSDLMGRAVSRIREEQAKQEREKHGEQWEDMSPELRQSFWSHLLADDTMKSPDEIQKKAEVYGVQADFTRMYQLFLLIPREIPDHFKSPEGRHVMEDFLLDLAEDVLKADLPETNYGWIYHRLWM